MARKLTAGVMLNHPGTGARVFLPTGSDLPTWATGLVGGHVLTADSQTEAGPVAVVASGKPPRKSGPGSSAAAWRKYAADREVQVPDDADRDQVIVALDEAGIPTV